MGETDAEEPVPISLGWGGAVATFWAISWPAWIMALFLASAMPIDIETLVQYPWLFSAILYSLYLPAQFLWVPRLTRKNYRYRVIGVIRDSGAVERKLRWREAWQVWRRMSFAQAALLSALGVVIGIIRWAPDEQTAKAFGTLSPLMWILVVGPLGVRWALTGDYTGFRLQAFRRRRWAKVPVIEATE